MAAVPLVLAGGFFGPGPSAPTAPVASCQNWTGVPPPSPGAGGNVLNGVTVVSACDAWAVGFSSDGTSTQTLTEHWNGTAWAVVLSPDPGSSFSRLRTVTTDSAGDAWAVGTYTSTGPAYPLALHCC